MTCLECIVHCTFTVFLMANFESMSLEYLYCPNAIRVLYIFRIVKWSDGSMSLHLGSEVFDVHKQPLQSDYNHLFIRQGTGKLWCVFFSKYLTGKKFHI